MSRKSLYIGRAGQMAVMAEFLLRGYNVVIPEVDVGDDRAVCSSQDLSFYVNNWQDWPFVDF